MSATSHLLLNPATDPPAILHRTEIRTVLHQTIANPTQHVYLHGPRGTGKTLLVQDALTSRSTPAYYLSCRRHDTQYKVLTQLYTRITGTELKSGYHTAQLQHRLAQHLDDTTALIVLDDLAFLLDNDGNDLLYFLSRLNQHTNLRIVGISAVHPTLRDVLDERTYSTLRPRRLTLPPYTTEEVVQILEQRVASARSPDTVDIGGLEYVAATTTNLALALHWLTCADARNTEITVDTLQHVRDTAVQRYRDSLLHDFTQHHRTLLTVIDQATADTATVTTGTVYSRYVTQCKEHGIDPVTIRRITDYLTHLERLNLITVTYHRGGTQGKTREIHPTTLQNL